MFDFEVDNNLFIFFYLNTVYTRDGTHFNFNKHRYLSHADVENYCLFKGFTHHTIITYLCNVFLWLTKLLLTVV